MAIKTIALLLALAMMPSGAHACSIIIQITLDFSAHSAELDRNQIVRLANWLDKVRSQYEYSNAEVEGSASTESPNGKSLAIQRAEATGRALQSLYAGIPIRVSGYAYSPSMQPEPHAAVVQLYPLNPPKCSGAVPIPGFKY